ncbi:hypothetical protein APR04_003809 [Promicromonospora umidemergens]|uniref:Minor tail protein n=1 Tax=Promicromonospora umidemergens TaxID=629679 RepID=A0ABP8XIN1_9MICO|nr:hypothetical protein [Promicromonospora umidemergens]MCP2284886.1 hypothetical protein [Promicromonospora umidemergens]
MAQSRSIVRPAGDPLIGTSPTELRQALAAGFARADASAFGVRPGVLWGGAVSGTAGWSYNVAPAGLVMSRGAVQGAYPAAITGVQAVPTDPAPGSGSRIDIVYGLQPDVDLGDTGNTPVIDVAIGVAAGSPAAPALPPGALELGRATISSAMAQTLDATVASTAPITTAAGGMYEVPSFSALSRVVAPQNLDVARVGTNALYVYQSGAWRTIWQAPGGVARRQTFTGASAFVGATGVTFSKRLAIVDHGTDGSRTVHLALEASAAPYVTGVSTAVWGSVAAGVPAPDSDAGAMFIHNSNMGLGIVAPSRVLQMQWGTFNSSGTTNLRATASYPVAAP